MEAINKSEKADSGRNYSPDDNSPGLNAAGPPSTPVSTESSPHLREDTRPRRKGGKQTTKQEEVLKAIQGDPGITRGELSENLKMHSSTLRYHLLGLFAKDLLKIWKSGGKEYLYPGELVLDPQVRLRFLLRDEWTAKVIAALCSTVDTSTVQATANHLKSDYKSVQRLLTFLEAMGFLRLEMEGTRKRIQILPDLYRHLHASTADLPSLSLTLLHIQRPDRPYPSISDSIPPSGETGNQN